MKTDEPFSHEDLCLYWRQMIDARDEMDRLRLYGRLTKRMRDDFARQSRCFSEAFRVLSTHFTPRS